MDITDLERAYHATRTHMQNTLMEVGRLALRSHTQTAWDNAIKDARDATQLHKETEARFEAKLNELYPE